MRRMMRTMRVPPVPVAWMAKVAHHGSMDTRSTTLSGWMAKLQVKERRKKRSWGRERGEKRGRKGGGGGGGEGSMSVFGAWDELELIVS